MNLYIEAAKFVEAKNASKKQTVESCPPLLDLASIGSRVQQTAGLKTDGRRIVALLRSAARYRMLLDTVLVNSGILVAERGRLGYAHAVLLVHDLLVSKTGITAGKGPLKDAVLRHRTRLRAELVKAKLRLQIGDLRTWNAPADEGGDRQVRWLRVNRLVAGPGELADAAAVAALFGFAPTAEYPPAERTVYADTYIPDLYAVANRHTGALTALAEYRNGKVIIQDRASCFPAYVLRPRPGDVVLDACAAPGNKTTHLCALTVADGRQQGRVVAFERDPARAGVLRKMVARAGARVRVLNRDFTMPFDDDSLGVDPASVTRVLCDPSCSGSGIFRRADGAAAATLDDDEEEAGPSTESRLVKLSVFQTEIVRHAMTAYPNVQTVVYSTCSVHAQENEVVVRNVLTDPALRRAGWRAMARKDVIPAWPRRGLPGPLAEAQAELAQPAEDVADGCVRAEPVVDGGIGFFVAGFWRDAASAASAGSDDAAADADADADAPGEPEWAGFDD
ncbi:S-adenosyl-L-methionine-dependent methyltransferase [Dipodascopsis tothii]|uniref:S-adenosyl-L-methionine-dependent methyltransferase n=1 Tax=Dipodascopsis tothii TaxID=44089 RepID=UPI0034D00E8E